MPSGGGDVNAACAMPRTCLGRAIITFETGDAMRLKLFASVATFALLTPAAAQTVPDRGAVTAKILDEGINHSEVVVIAEHLADVIGPRLTNSPAMRKAESWTQDEFRGWGLVNVHREGFEFGRGWWIEHSSVRMTAPRPIQLTAIPIAWTPATNGALSAPIVVAPMAKISDFAKWKGKLAGKIVLISQPSAGSEPREAPFQRLSGKDLADLDEFEQPRYDPQATSRQVKRLEFQVALDTFLKAEGAVAWARQSIRDGKLVHGEGYLFTRAYTPALPGVEIAAEDYRRLARLAKVGDAPVLEIDSLVHFDDSDSKAYNVIAEIPGTDPKAGYVMAGAHLDSWVAGDGAADNGAGSAVVLEAARIIARSGIRPRRTIRFALWAGEEQGLLGSRAYADQHLATRGNPNDPPPAGLADYLAAGERFPVNPKPEWSQLSAYFNLDNGSGRVRGIYAENNPAVVPIFREWLAPFAPMGASNVVIQKTGGTDHVFLQAIGIPGFQFIQDPLDYDTRVHHTSIDTFDHLNGDDLRQAATIMASFLVNAANAEKSLPRPPLPTKPTITDPFAYARDDN